MRRLIRTPLKWLFPFFVVFLLWELAAAYLVSESYFLPPPHTVLQIASEMVVDGSLIKYSLISFHNAILGLIIGVSIALVLAVLCAIYDSICDFFVPLVSASYPVPTIIWVPLSLLWFGFSSTSLIFVVSLGCFFSMFYSVLVGLKSTDPKFVAMAKNLRLGRWEYMREIVLYGSFPHILAGLRLSAGQSWRIIVGAEMLASTSKGLGYFLWISHEFFKYEQIFVGMVTIGLIGFSVEKLLFETLETRTLQRWY